MKLDKNGSRWDLAWEELNPNQSKENLEFYNRAYIEPKVLETQQQLKEIHQKRKMRILKKKIYKMTSSKKNEIVFLPMESEIEIEIEENYKERMKKYSEKRITIVDDLDDHLIKKRRIDLNEYE